MTQVLDVPLKRPQIKTLPDKTAELYKVLRMLSGQFAVAVLRASQADMLSRQWQESSQNISLISKLLMQWVYEDFEVRSFRQTLIEIRDWTGQLYIYLEKMLPNGGSKTATLETTSRLYHKSKELLEKYEAHYLKLEAPNHLAIWQDEKTGSENSGKWCDQRNDGAAFKTTKIMIGKVGLGRYAKGILQYCYYDKQLSAKQINELGPKDVRGELVYIQNLALQKAAGWKV